MMQLLSSFLQSMLPEAMKAVGAEAVAGEAAAAAIPEAVASSAPMSMGQAVGDIATQSVGQQIQPAMNLYNQVTAPNATAGDMARSAFEYSIKSEKDPQNQVTCLL